ncbi:unnamed protein product, partial [Amoebophrya sp. A25]
PHTTGDHGGIAMRNRLGDPVRGGLMEKEKHTGEDCDTTGLKLNVNDRSTMHSQQLRYFLSTADAVAALRDFFQLLHEHLKWKTSSSPGGAIPVGGGRKEGCRQQEPRVLQATPPRQQDPRLGQPQHLVVRQQQSTSGAQQTSTSESTGRKQVPPTSK